MLVPFSCSFPNHHPQPQFYLNVRISTFGFFSSSGTLPPWGFLTGLLLLRPSVMLQSTLQTAAPGNKHQGRSHPIQISPVASYCTWRKVLRPTQPAGRMPSLCPPHDDTSQHGLMLATLQGLGPPLHPLSGQVLSCLRDLHVPCWNALPATPTELLFILQISA